MRTAILSACYLHGMDPQGNARLDRNKFYLDYYLKLKDVLGWETLWLVDNASSESAIADLLASVHFNPSVHVWRCGTHFPRGIGPNPYPYCWRMLYFARQLIAGGYEKILFIDSDALITSQRLAKHVGDLREGWEALWCRRHEFPTAEFHVLCQDAFPRFLEFTLAPMETHFGKLMETALPYTRVNKEFYADRSGETKDPQVPGQDLYGQFILNRAPIYS